MKRFNHICTNEQNVYCQVALHIFVVINSLKTVPRRPNMWEFMYVMCFVLVCASVGQYTDYAVFTFRNVSFILTFKGNYTSVFVTALNESELSRTREQV
jgi:uncharacterized membrane protein YjdF